MKVMHLISGGEKGGSKTHVLSLVQELQKKMDITLMCLMAGDFFEQGKKMGLNIETVVQKRRYHLHAVGELGRKLRREGYTLLHCHGPRANFYGALIKTFYKIPTVTTIHSDFLQDFQHNYYKHKVYTTLNTLALNTFDGYLVVSGNLKEMLLSRGISVDKITQIYNGLDFNAPIQTVRREDFLKKYGLSVPPTAKVVGILARLHPIKGHDVFLRGAKLILDAEPTTHFILGGDGEEKDKLMDLRDKLGLADRVHFAGQIFEPLAFMQAVDILTLTSYSEGFPYVLLEGALVRKPVVSSDVGGINMLIEDGKTGMLFSAGNEAAFADQVIKLLQDRMLATELGENLYLRAKENFSLSSLAAAHVEVYNQFGKGVN